MDAMVRSYPFETVIMTVFCALKIDLPSTFRPTVRRDGVL
jgi:hypothetical protein